MRIRGVVMFSVVLAVASVSACASQSDKAANAACKYAYSTETPTQLKWLESGMSTGPYNAELGAQLKQLVALVNKTNRSKLKEIAGRIPIFSVPGQDNYDLSAVHDLLDECDHEHLPV
jgi:hypothetical protein